MVLRLSQWEDKPQAQIWSCDSVNVQGYATKQHPNNSRSVCRSQTICFLVRCLLATIWNSLVISYIMMRSSALSDVWWGISFSLGQLKQMDEARAWPHRGGRENPGRSDAMGRVGMNYWCRLRLRSPWVQGGGRYIVCLDESGGKKSLDTLSHASSLSCTQWENISSDYRSVSSASTSRAKLLAGKNVLARPARYFHQSMPYGSAQKC